MKKEMVVTDIYEVGDLLDISEVKPLRSATSRQTLAKASRCIVILCNELKYDAISYKVISNEGNSFVITSDEMKKAKFIKNINISKLFE